MSESPHMPFYEWVETLSNVEKKVMLDNLDGYPLAAPQEGPQTEVFRSAADVVGYGGAAGGGKSALAALLAIHEHQKTVIFRREMKQLSSLIDDMVQFAGTDSGLNRQAGMFRYESPSGPKKIEWGGLKDPDDWLTWRGRDHDLICFEEATEIPYSQVKKVTGWLRSTTPGQRCRILFTFNPPGTVDPGSSEATQQLITSGRWIVDYFAPWLSERHPDPAQPGELRYYWRDSNGIEQEKKDGKKERVELHGKSFFVKPQSRTFIPALVTDNKYLATSGYMDHLLTLEEPFRSQMLLGDFRSGITDDEDQIIKTEWVDEAMDRWQEQRPLMRAQPMNALGVDVSRGGNDATILVARHRFWWDKPIRMQGKESDDGPKVASKCFETVRDGAEICIDAIGAGSSPLDFLNQAMANTVPVLSQKREFIPQPNPIMKCYNLRASLWLLLKKVLDPANGCLAALPPDNRLRSELISVRRKDNTTGYFQVENKLDVKKRLGFSPDEADAVVYTLMNILKEPWGEHLQSTIGPRIDLDELYQRAYPVRTTGWMAN